MPLLCIYVLIVLLDDACFCFQALTWKLLFAVQDLWHQMRFTVIGYAMLLLGLCFWMFYILPKQPQDSNPATGMPQEAPVSTRSSGNIFVSQPQSRMPSS